MERAIEVHMYRSRATRLYRQILHRESVGVVQEVCGYPKRHVFSRSRHSKGHVLIQCPESVRMAP